MPDFKKLKVCFFEIFAKNANFQFSSSLLRWKEDLEDLNYVLPLTTFNRHWLYARKKIFGSYLPKPQLFKVAILAIFLSKNAQLSIFALLIHSQKGGSIPYLCVASYLPRTHPTFHPSYYFHDFLSLDSRDQTQPLCVFCVFCLSLGKSGPLTSLETHEATLAAGWTLRTLE